MPMYRIKELEESKGNLRHIIPPLVNEHGQSKSARILGVCSATINRWLKENHYRKEIVYVGENETIAILPKKGMS